ELRREAPLLGDTTRGGGEVRVAIAGRVHGRELFGRYVTGYGIENGRAVLEVAGEPDPEGLDVGRLLRDVTVSTAEGVWNLRVVARPQRTVAAAVPAPPLGWTAVCPVHVLG